MQNKKQKTKTTHKKSTQNLKIYVLVITFMVFLLLLVHFSLPSPPFPCLPKEADYLASRNMLSEKTHYIAPTATLGSGHLSCLWGFNQKPVPSQRQGAEHKGHSTADGHTGRNYDASLTAGQTRQGLSTAVIFWDSNVASLL